MDGTSDYIREAQDAAATPSVPRESSDKQVERHEWGGCEEVNGFFSATCSCGWTYQHPNYGTDQESFVNHWGDHILAALPVSEQTESVKAQDAAEGDKA